MKSQTGALLTKIAGIIDIVIGGIILFFGLIAIFGLTLYQGIPYNLFILLLTIPLMFFVLGGLILNSSKKMENAKTVKNGSIWAIVLGVLTMQFFTGVLTLIGGIIALIDSDKKK